MKVKLSNTSNMSIQDEIGKEFNCRRLNGWLELEYLDKPDYGIQTSTIEHIEEEKRIGERKK